MKEYKSPGEIFHQLFHGSILYSIQDCTGGLTVIGGKGPPGSNKYHQAVNLGIPAIRRREIVFFILTFHLLSL
jgi:hypothetical protein